MKMESNQYFYCSFNDTHSNRLEYASVVIYGSATFTRELYKKEYELKDHLDNVRLVFSDLKKRTDDTTFDLYISTVNNYYPFGMLQPGRYWQSGNYRYGFNSMEKDDEIKGVGNSYTTDFRQYDSRLGRWLSADPIDNAMESSYVGFGNNPIIYTDPLGLKINEKGLIETDEVVVEADRNVEPTIRAPEYTFWQLFVSQWKSEITQDLDKNFISSPLSWARGAINQTIYTTIDNTKVAVEQIGIHIGLNDNEYATGLDDSFKNDKEITDAGIEALLTIGYTSIAKVVKGSVEAVVEVSDRQMMKSLDELVKEAQKKYPKLAGKIQNHHITPKYLGGAMKGPLIKIDAAYHQKITNEFRKKWEYGLGRRPNYVELELIIDDVYKKYPLK